MHTDILSLHEILSNHKLSLYIDILFFLESLHIDGGVEELHQDLPVQALFHPSVIPQAADTQQNLVGRLFIRRKYHVSWAWVFGVCVS